MTRVFNTKIEELLEGVKSNEGIGGVINSLYNLPKNYEVVIISEGALRSGRYTMEGMPVFANEHFRVLTREYSNERILYEFLRTDSDLVTSVYVTKPKPKQGELP
jgi:hypothetical protein